MQDAPRGTAAPAHTAQHVPAQTSRQVATLNRVMAAAGWEINYVDLDLTGAQPKVEIKVQRHDGRWLFARVDALGRCTLERFHRARTLGMDPRAKGRRPLTPLVTDEFLGRQKPEGPRAMLRLLTAYVAENALHPVALSDVRSAWGALMAAPALITTGSAQ